MQDLSRNVPNVHTVTQQLTSAVPSTSSVQQPNGFSALASTSSGQKRNISAICSHNRVFKARVNKKHRNGYDFSSICRDYIRANRDLQR